MTSYLAGLLNSPNFERLAKLKPKNLCPYLYYNISPYVFTLAEKGWFSWVERKSNPTDRTPPKIKHPEKKKINRLFPNEVLVRCPNPVNSVIAGIGPWEKGTTAVRILHCSGECPFGHRPDRRIIPILQPGAHSFDYSRLFPEILLRAMTDMSLWNVRKRCDTLRGGTIFPAEIVNACRYHKKPAFYSFRNLLPDNCCPHVFQQVYPYILAIMYNADVNNTVMIQHPGEDERMTLKLEKTVVKQPWLIKKPKDVFFSLFGRFFYPLDRFDYTLTLRYLSGKTPDGCTVQQGRRFAVNLRRPDFLCPAGFHAAYPFLLLAAAGKSMDWGANAPPDRVPCPDCAGIIYGINSRGFRSRPGL